MMQSPTTLSPLETFLKRPDIEGSPAWEYINGRSQQEPMPTLFHSRLQRNLVNTINQQTRDYEAIQALRCVVPPFSPVPHIAVIEIPRTWNKKERWDLTETRFSLVIVLQAFLGRAVLISLCRTLAIYES
ncbi:MAG: Uma2 family endonuclease [Phormidesmis sp.]